MDLPEVKDVIYQRYTASERMRNLKEMKRFQQKLTTVCLETNIIKKFKDLIKDDRKILEFSNLIKESNDDTVPGEKVADEMNSVELETQDAMTNNDRNYNENEHGDDDERGDDQGDENVSFGVDDKIVLETIDNDGDLQRAHDLAEMFVRHDYNMWTAAEEIADEPISVDAEDKELFEDVDRDANASDTIVYGGHFPDAAGERAEARLDSVEACCAACVLEKWIGRIDLLDALDGGTVASSTDDACPDATKMGQLRAFVSQTLSDTVRELRASGTFGALRSAADSMMQTVRDERLLFVEHEANRKSLTAMRNKKKRSKQRHNEEKWRLEMSRLQLGVQLENIKKLIKIETEYMYKWEDQWLTENKEVLWLEERNLQRQISCTDKQIEQEDICMQEARRVFSEYTESVGRHVELWDNMYDQQVNNIDIDILTLEQQLQELDEAHDKLEEEIDKLQTSVDAFEGRKRERETRAKYIESVIKIQAFWRGIMVRKSLGPYKDLWKKKQSKKTKKPRKKTKNSNKKW